MVVAVGDGGDDDYDYDGDKDNDGVSDDGGACEMISYGKAGVA